MSSSTVGGRFLARLPLAVVVLDPEDVLEPVGDREAAILGALGDDALRPEVHRKLRPVVLAGGKLGPLLLQLPLPASCAAPAARAAPSPARSRRRASASRAAPPASPPRAARAAPRRTPPAPRSRDAPSPTGSHPSSAPGWSAGAPRRRASEPARRSAAGRGCRRSAGARTARRCSDPTACRAATESAPSAGSSNAASGDARRTPTEARRADRGPAGQATPPPPPTTRQRSPRRPCRRPLAPQRSDRAGRPGSSTRTPLAGKSSGYPGGALASGQAIVTGQHPRRADRQRIKRLRLSRQLPLTRRQPDIEPAERDPHRPRHQLSRQTRRIGSRIDILLVIRLIDLARSSSASEPSTSPKALADRAAISLVDPVQLKAALIDLSLDRVQLRLDRPHPPAHASARAASDSPSTCSNAGNTNACEVSIRVSSDRFSDQRDARASRELHVRRRSTVGDGSALDEPDLVLERRTPSAARSRSIEDAQRVQDREQRKQLSRSIVGDESRRPLVAEDAARGRHASAKPALRAAGPRQAWPEVECSSSGRTSRPVVVIVPSQLRQPSISRRPSPSSPRDGSLQ